MVIEVRAPIFVFREWHRHRTQSYNEMSARYAPLPDLNYVPSVERLMLKSDANKQAGAAKGSEELSSSQAEAFRRRLERKYEYFQHDYELSLQQGVPKELARCAMPVGRYSQMRASACLRNWLAFLTLRLDKNAQWEIRQYARSGRRHNRSRVPVNVEAISGVASMMTVTQHIRRRIESSIAMRPSLSELRKTEWSKPFETLMRNRLIMGAFRYGLKKTKGDQGYDMVGSLEQRVQAYKKTGNLELLADVANLALLEFEYPSHSKAHFAPEDDGEHCF